jgi:hypothetical protein
MAFEIDTEARDLTVQDQDGRIVDRFESDGLGEARLAERHVEAVAVAEL